MMRAHLIQHRHIGKIPAGKKTWEMRSARTTIRETIALVPSGSGTVIGVCDLVDCIGFLTAAEYRKDARKAGHRPSDAKLGYYKKTYAWVVKNPRTFKKPSPYKHPSGAIIWVTLDPKVGAGHPPPTVTCLQDYECFQQQVQALECSVCGQLVDPKDVHVGSFVLLLARLKKERFALCPLCTREVPPDLQRDAEYQTRWTPFVRQMLRDLKRFKPKPK